MRTNLSGFKIKLLLISIFAFFSLTVYPQKQEEFKSWKDRVFFGGNIGLMFGTITDIEISPLVGYHISPRWAAGCGLTYEYYKRNDFIKIETHIYGSSLFTRYTLFPDFSTYFPVGEGLSLYAQAEYQVLSLEERYFRSSASLGDRSGRYLLHSYLVGGGIMQKLGRRGGFNITVLWNLNETQDTPYTNPIIRFGFMF